MIIIADSLQRLTLADSLEPTALRLHQDSAIGADALDLLC